MPSALSVRSAPLASGDPVHVGRIAGDLGTVRVSPSGSVSLVSTPLPVVKLRAASSSVVPRSAVAVGPSLVPVMVMVTVAVSVPPLPSVTV